MHGDLVLAPDGTVTAAWAGSDRLWITASRDGGLQFSPPQTFGACRAPMTDCVQGADIPAQSDAVVRANPVLVELPPIGGEPAQVLALYAGVGGAPSPHTFWTDSRDLASAGEEIFTATLAFVSGTGPRG